MYVDHSDEFWPTAGWMTWACWALGVFDVSLFAFLVHQIAR